MAKYQLIWAKSTVILKSIFGTNKTAYAKAICSSRFTSNKVFCIASVRIRLPLSTIPLLNGDSAVVVVVFSIFSFSLISQQLLLLNSPPFIR